MCDKVKLCLISSVRVYYYVTRGNDKNINMLLLQAAH